MSLKPIYFRIAFILALPCALLLSCSKSQTPDTPIAEYKSSAKKVVSFTFANLNPPVSATVDGSGFWRATVPVGTDKAHLVPTLVLSDKATVLPASGVAWDFTVNSNGVIDFVVTAEDGTKQTYGVQVQ